MSIIKGDRVAVYGYDSDGGMNYGKKFGHTATVLSAQGFDLEIKWDETSEGTPDTSYVHAKQCRKLVVKRKWPEIGYSGAV